MLVSVIADTNSDETTIERKHSSSNNYIHVTKKIPIITNKKTVEFDKFGSVCLPV